MIKRGGGLRFLDKTAESPFVISKLRRQQLERDFAIELSVIGEVDLAHSTFSKGRNYLVVSNDLPYRQGRLPFGDYFCGGLKSRHINEPAFPFMDGDERFQFGYQFRV